MENLMTKERMVDTDYDQYQLCYHIHQMKEEGMRYYGISISQYMDGNGHQDLFDQAVIPAFSENYKETEAFFETLVQETVFPVHLYSIADDWYGTMTS